MTELLELLELLEFLVRKDIYSIVLQILFFYFIPIIWVYKIAYATREKTHIKSHSWIFAGMAFSTLIVYPLYYLYLLLPPKLWVMLLTVLFYWLISGFISVFVADFVKGKALTDTDSYKERLFQTDERLIPRCSLFTLLTTIFFSYALRLQVS